MSTPAQVAANQQNAQFSTGPKSDAGKMRSSQNACNHGFRSLGVLLPSEDPAEYEALLEELGHHFSLRDLTEQRFIREMADAEWRLRRARRLIQLQLEDKIAALSLEHPGLDPHRLQLKAHLALAAEAAPLLKYEQKFERQYERAYHGWCKYQQQSRQARDQDFEAQLKSPPPTAQRQADQQADTNEPNPGHALTPRNASCPCGSGRKYKRCCGLHAPPVLGRRQAA
jgi:hypothetical protein